jgi:hypothetical protein
MRRDNSQQGDSASPANGDPVEVEMDDSFDDDTFDTDGALSRGFLLRRGFCCENGCKNCPYGFQKTSRLDATRHPEDGPADRTAYRQGEE